MAKLTRRNAIVALGVGSGLLGLRYALWDTDTPAAAIEGDARGLGVAEPGMCPGMMDRSMMGSATRADMSTYMDMFNRHREIRRAVEEIPGGVRTTTESDAPELVAQLQAHVSAMYIHLAEGTEVRCMSDSLPILFDRAPDYRRRISLTPQGVVAEETADDPGLTQAIRDHAREVSGFVTEGMPAMMNQMMGHGS